jgi:tetrahydromethanopterin S-methyltransferase subunit G
MPSTIISTDDLEGSVTYEINYGNGVVREQLFIADYPDADAVTKRMQEREEQVVAEVAKRPSKVIPTDVKQLVGVAIAVDVVAASPAVIIK